MAASMALAGWPGRDPSEPRWAYARGEPGGRHRAGPAQPLRHRACRRRRGAGHGRDPRHGPPGQGGGQPAHPGSLGATSMSARRCCSTSTTRTASAGLLHGGAPPTGRRCCGRCWRSAQRWPPRRCRAAHPDRPRGVADAGRRDRRPARRLPRGAGTSGSRCAATRSGGHGARLWPPARPAAAGGGGGRDRGAGQRPARGAPGMCATRATLRRGATRCAGR